MAYVTRLASLDSYEKGGSRSSTTTRRTTPSPTSSRSRRWPSRSSRSPSAKNFEYVLEAVRVEGTSGWRAAAHDQSALVLDGEVEFTFMTLRDGQALPESGSGGVPDDAAQAPMGRVTARRGHLTLLPAGRAYRLRVAGPAVLLIQTVEGPDTQFRWAEICQTA